MPRVSDVVPGCCAAKRLRHTRSGTIEGGSIIKKTLTVVNHLL